MNKRTFLSILGYFSIFVSVFLLLTMYVPFFFLFLFFGLVALALADILKGQKEILDYIHAQNNPSVELSQEEKQRLKDKVVVNWEQKA